MEQELNGLLPLGLGKRPAGLVDSCFKDQGEGFEESNLNRNSGAIPYDDKYCGYLGYGYNVITKRYYNSLDLSLSAPILSKQADKGGRPLKIYIDNGTYIETTDIAALWAEDYSKKISAKAGLDVQVGAFKASFNMAFSNESKMSASKSFATRRHELTLKREYFDLSEVAVTDLRDRYLAPTFRRDVNNPSLSANELFTRYGTHLLLDIRLGGRMELDFMHEKKDHETEMSLTTSLEASYMAVSGQASTEYQNIAKHFFDSSSFHCVLIGGAVSTNISTMKQAQEAYEKWSKSLDPAVTENPSLSFIGTGSLDNPSSVLPVWSLADSLSRQQELKEGFMALLNESGGYFKKLQDKVFTSYIKNIYVGIGNSANEASSSLHAVMASHDPGAPQFIITKDLNCSAGGKFEFLGYTTTTKPDEAIRGIRGMADPKNNCASAYQVGNCTYNRLYNDLNCGAKGHYVYLYWTKDAAAGNPLLAADVEINYIFSHYGEPGWSRVRLIYNNGDLNTNRGTGGKTYDIFVWVKQEL